MPNLSLIFKDAVQGEFPMQKGASLTIGRKETNSVIIDNLAVSGSHAKIDYLDEGILLTDLKSKNGTFVNGKMVTSHWLQKEDVISIGKHKLVLSFEDGESAPSGSNLTDKTMVLDTDEYRAMIEKSGAGTTAQTPSQGADAGGKDALGVLSFLKGGDGEIELTKKLVKIGKDPSSDIVLGGFMMAKTAVTISKRPTGFYLNFVEGMNKPKVNGTAVRDSVKLKEFDIIEIGSTKMEFILKE